MPGLRVCKKVWGLLHDYMKTHVFFSLDVLPKAESQLNDIRKEMFTELQPQLKCELGK